MVILLTRLWLILNFTDIVKFFLAVACPIIFSLLCDSAIEQCDSLLKWCFFSNLGHFGSFPQIFDEDKTSSVLDVFSQARIFLFIFVSVILCFYVSQKFFRSGNTANTKDLKRIPNPETRPSNCSELTSYCELSPQYNDNLQDNVPKF